MWLPYYEPWQYILTLFGIPYGAPYDSVCNIKVTTPKFGCLKSHLTSSTAYFSTLLFWSFHAVSLSE